MPDPNSEPVRIDRQAAGLDDFLTQIGIPLTSPFETASDPLSSGALHKQQLGRTPAIKYGKIQYAMPYLNWYRVALDDCFGVLPCTRLTDGSTNLLGVSDSSFLAPDTNVMVLLYPGTAWGYILGVVPDLVENGNSIFSDWISQGSNCGLKREKYYRDMLTLLGDAGGAIDFSNHRPLDQLSLDWGRIAETGLGLHIDPFMLWLRVDELCGIYGFYHDRLLRVLGHNLEIHSGAHSELFRNDEGESTIFRGESPYPWELLGAFKYGNKVIAETSDKDVHLSAAKGKLEPLFDDQQPFFRYQEYGGYLGQGRLRIVTLPPDQPPEVNRYKSEEALLGVFREQISLDGSYALESAKSVVIAKRSLIVVPKRLKPEDDYSDSCDSAENKNYKAAGQYGKGDPHKIGDIKAEGTQPGLLSTAAILDMHAHAFNWKGVHPFHYHKKDYALPEESKLKLRSNQEIPSFGQLGQNMWLERTPGKKMRVDDRYGDVNYYEVLSHVSLTEDGGVVIQGGGGEEIRMVRGNIQISCPGNIYLQPGKSVVNLAGDDIILRAKNSVDITASEHDVRLKAEKNMQLLSGNGGQGGTLIENRATDMTQEYPDAGGEKINASGVVVRCPQAQFATLTAGVYLRTGSQEGQINSGDIVLDADKGSSNIRTVSDKFERYLRTHAADSFGVPNITAVNKYTASQFLVGTSLLLEKDARVREQLTVGSSIVSVDGAIETSGNADGKVLQLRNREAFRSRLDDVDKQEQQAVKDRTADLQSKIEEALHGEGKIGNDTTARKISVSLREEEEYRTTDFLLPETHWQILAAAGSGTGVWDEKVVKYQGTREMAPWPGKKSWQDQETLLTLPADSHTMYDVVQGQAKPRPEPYEDAKYPKFVKKTPAKSYKVIT